MKQSLRKDFKVGHSFEPRVYFNVHVLLTFEQVVQAKLGHPELVSSRRYVVKVASFSTSVLLSAVTNGKFTLQNAVRDLQELILKVSQWAEQGHICLDLFTLL